MHTRALLVELLLSAFFALACFRARSQDLDVRGLTPQRLFALQGRLERLRNSRWQWFAMILLLVVVRLQLGAPLMAELTVLVQFLVFMALPAAPSASEALRRS